MPASKSPRPPRSNKAPETPEKAARSRQGGRPDSKSGGKPAPHGKRQTLVEWLTELIYELETFEVPADAMLSQFFRTRPFFGGRERHILAEGAYCWLRFRLRINHLSQGGSGSSVPRQAKLALLWSGAPEDVWAKGKPADNDWLSRVINVSPNDLPQEPKTCLPAWLFDTLVEEQGAAQAMRFAVYALSAAPLDVRVNTLKTTPEVLLGQFAEQGVQAQPIEGLPGGLRVEGKPPLGRTELFANGHFEVQDAGSQWVSRLAAPRRGDLVVDFCAGAGGKTLSIAALMKNTGRIVAVDNSERRLQKFKPRAARSGQSNCTTLLINDEHDPRLNRYFGKADRVVVDVPCSGTGTLRRNPDLKFRQSRDTVAQLNQLQASILEAASRLVKPDGRLIYMTCSVLRSENEAIVEAFLANHPEFRLRKWTEVLGPSERPAGVDLQAECLRMWPDVTQTDGFFAAVLQRNKTPEVLPDA
ncbi:MAG: RsmB/NOP family class I SAM-dependent RNA methyltransferase [Limnobacter sp.]|nr:RsmB/NOP family class I SAM-dependent RNA methyltransferase [Limnobacter sp.]